MGWVYLDDGFVDHPKVDAAGGDAGWLYVCGLSYARRTGSEGKVPKHRLARLSDRENAVELAARLVKVGLWLERKDHYEIHDYGIWNAKAEKRRVQAKAAARKRWEKERADADEMREQMREHEPGDMQEQQQEHDEGEQCESNAYMGHSPKPHPDPDPHSSSSSVSEEPPLPPGVNPDDDDRLWKIWAWQDRTRLINETGEYPHDDEAWLAKAALNRQKRHGVDLARLLDVEPFLSDLEVIARLTPSPTQESKPTALDATAAAARAVMERDRSCPDCNGTGWLDDGADEVLPCACRNSVAS